MVTPRPARQGALAGAAGLTAAVLTRPKDAEAAYFLQGDAINSGSSATSIVAQAGYANGSYIFRADANPTNNTTAAIDGLQGQGAGIANGVRAFGGQKNGPGVHSQGGGSTGPGLVALAAGGTYGASFQGEGLIAQGSGASSGPGVVARGGGGNGIGLLASAGGTAFTTIFLGTGVMATGSTGVSGGSGWGLYATGSGSSTAATVPQSAAVVAIGGVFNSSFLGPLGGPGLYAVGGPSTGQIQLAPASSAGPPNGNTSQKGELWVDSNGTLWICTASVVYDVNGGVVTPGVWAPLQEGGLNNALFTAVSTQQYTLLNSNGTTWNDIDAINLTLTITPGFKCAAVISGNSDLWTSVAGFNQDIGIAISGGAYPSTAGQPEAWKESGGFAGTFSPNAAFVETVVPLAAGTTYTVKLRWKANKAGASKIWAGAGPSAPFSPTRLTAMLVATQ